MNRSQEKTVHRGTEPAGMVLPTGGRRTVTNGHLARVTQTAYFEAGIEKAGPIEGRPSSDPRRWAGYGTRVIRFCGPGATGEWASK